MLNKHNYDRVLSIISEGFYCCNFLDFNDSNEGVFPIKKNISNVDLSSKLKYKICSFSAHEALNNELMWGHYAGAGMGVAIEIEVPDCTILRRVDYDVENHNYSSVEDVLSNKSNTWRYEHEWRYITNSECKHFKHAIKKIHFGTPYQHLENYQELKTRHSKLRRYLKLSQSLKLKCESEGIHCSEISLSQ